MSDKISLLVKNQNLFSNNYLNHRLPETTLWSSQKEKATIIFEEIQKIYESVKTLKLGPGEEAGLEDKFIRPVLKLLDFEWDVQPTTNRGTKKKRPDYALFKNKDSYKTAREERQNFKRFFSHAITILEAKYWGRRLNDTDLEDTIDHRDPTAQAVKYLDDVYYASNGRIQWAILTNGKQWRLFYYRASSRSGNFFEIDLEELITENNPEKFLYFYLFFSKDAFVADAVTGKIWLDQHLEGSEAYAKAISERLKDLIFDNVFEGLAEGFIHYRRNELSITEETAESKREIFKGCLTLLYRLLFLLYAESRNLLPVQEDGYYRVSLKKLKEDIYKDLSIIGLDKISKRSYVYWARLEGIFKIIAEGDHNLNVPIYNGGLFEASKDSFLSIHKMPDPFLADAIKLLTIDQGGEYTPDTIPFIDYSSLSVRHLGDIYEGLLEFHIQIADEDMVEVRESNKSIWKRVSELRGGTRMHRRKSKGGVYIENSKHERKATGSYYTPHYIVEYIVKNTVGQTLEYNLKTAAGLLVQLEKAIKATHRQQSTSSIKSHRAEILEIEDAIFNTLFDIKVLDSAMGSGHFLVHTVDFISDKIISFLADYPKNPVIKRIEELKKEIIGEIKRQGVTIDESKLTEVNLIKRMVMKRCIYGVDLNEMAVELAKLSLWLGSFTLGAPLSFLDHHLKCGNSLLGILDISDVVTIGSEAYLKLQRSLSFMLQVSKLTDATISETKKSYALFKNAQQSVEPIKRRSDIVTAKYFIDIDSSGARAIVEKLSYTPDLRNEPNQEIFEKYKMALLQIAQDKRFFHWKLEFPEVFYTERGEKENPGFDCVIGNPPWGAELSQEEKDYCRTLETDTSTPNSYIYIIRRSELLLRQKGFAGVIVPDSILVKDYAITRCNLLCNNTLLYIIYLEHVFKDVNHDSALIVFRRGKPHKHNLFGGLVPRDETAIDNYLLPLEESYFKDAELEYRFNLNFNPINAVLYKKLSILQKIGDIGDFHEGIHTGNVRDKLFYKNKPKYHNSSKIKPCLIGSNYNDEFGRYYCTPNNNWTIYESSLIDKEKGEYASLRDENIFIGPKLYVTRTGDTFYSFYDEDHYASNNLFSFKFKSKDTAFSYFFIMAIMNSNFAQRYNRLFLAPRFGELFTETKIIHLKLLPIPRISFTTPEDKRKKKVAEVIDLYKEYMVKLQLDFKGELYENQDRHKVHRKMEEGAHASREKTALSEEHTSSGLQVHGIRGRTGESGHAERVSEDPEEYKTTTRFIESSLGIKSYKELAPFLARGVEKVLSSLLECKREDIIVTPEFICKLHRDAFGELFPDWAGRYRDRDVTVSGYTPPPYYEVPILMRQYCDDLEARLASIAAKSEKEDTLIEILAFAEGRFLSIHPFLDFNGRVVRMLLFALLYRFDLPPVQLVPDEKDEKGKEEYLKALSEADKFNWQPLIEIWNKRLGAKG